MKEFVTGSSFVFNFKNSLIFNNATTAIKNLTVDFDDGDPASLVISNNTIVIPSKTVNYTGTGAKTLKFTLTYSDDTTLVTYAYVYVNYKSDEQSYAPNNANDPCYELLKDKGVFTSTIPFQGYTESSPVYGKTEYTIFYGNNNTAKQMLKPIIVVDGFDPKDKRKVQDCDCENDTTPAPNNCRLNNSDVTISWFPFRITITFNPLKHESLEDLMNYNVDGQPVNLIDKLRAKGYDVIVINNPTYKTTNTAGQTVTVDGGADYIERNAMTLVSYMQYIKTQQNIAGSTENLVLIGPSMGGQITRYALAYMEKKFAETNDPVWKHNARLWVSVDSPHLGANIPVGAQANIWFLAEGLGKEEAKIQYYEELNSVAGKQQIISQLKNARETGYLNGNSFFTTYYNNLNSNGVAGSGGYPVSTNTFRKIAMVNGSLTGKKDASEQQTFLYMRGYIRGLWPFQSSTITLLRLQDNFMPTSGQTGTVFKGDGQNSTFNIGFNHWYINFSHPRYELKVNNNSIKGSLDVVPGGYFKTAKYIQEAVSKGLREADVRQETRDYIENHSFIPTFSALGHLQPYQNWGNPLNFNLACSTNKLTPFDSYFGAANNTEHTSFTKESVDWLMKELDGEPQSPWFPIEASQFIGSNTICVNSVSEYIFPDPCKLPSNVTWSLSNTNAQIFSSTGNSVTLKGLSSGSVILTATFQNNQTLTKKIWIGIPSFTIEPADNNTNYVTFYAKTGNFSFEEMGVPPSNVVWRRLDNGQTKTGYSYFAHAPGYNWSFNVEVKATNGCGTFTTYATITPPPPPICDTYLLAKEGISDNYVVLKQVDPECANNANQAESYEITVANSMGVILVSKKGRAFNLQGFSTGTYIVNIRKGNNTVVNQTLIKH